MGEKPDFKKKKRKVGKAKGLNPNETVTSFKSRKLVLRNSAPAPSSKDEALLSLISSRKLSIPQLFSRLNHHNCNSRRDAVMGLCDIIKNGASTAVEHVVGQLLLTAIPLAGDVDGRTRLAVNTLFKAAFQRYNQEKWSVNLSDAMNSCALHLQSFLTSIQKEIQKAAVNLLEQVLTFLYQHRHLWTMQTSLCSQIMQSLTRYLVARIDMIHVKEVAHSSKALSSVHRCLEMTLGSSHTIDIAPLPVQMEMHSQSSTPIPGCHSITLAFGKQAAASTQPIDDSVLSAILDDVLTVGDPWCLRLRDLDSGNSLGSAESAFIGQIISSLTLLVQSSETRRVHFATRVLPFLSIPLSKYPTALHASIVALALVLVDHIDHDITKSMQNYALMLCSHLEQRNSLSASSEEILKQLGSKPCLMKESFWNQLSDIAAKSTRLDAGLHLSLYRMVAVSSVSSSTKASALSTLPSTIQRHHNGSSDMVIEMMQKLLHVFKTEINLWTLDERTMIQEQTVSCLWNTSLMNEIPVVALNALVDSLSYFQHHTKQVFQSFADLISGTALTHTTREALLWNMAFSLEHEEKNISKLLSVLLSCAKRLSDTALVSVFPALLSYEQSIMSPYKSVLLQDMMARQLDKLISQSGSNTSILLELKTRLDA